MGWGKSEGKDEMVVIAGVGVVSSLGIGRDEFWQALRQSKCGLGPITLFDTSNFENKIAGEVKNFQPQQILGEKRLIDLDRSSLLLLSGVKLALEDAKFTINEDDSYKVGIVVGTTFGSFTSISKFMQESLTEGPRYVNPSIFPNVVVNSPASRVSIKFNIKGPCTTLSTGICAGLDAISYAQNLITETSNLDVFLAGCVEDLSLFVFLGFRRLECLAKGEEIQSLCFPFDKRRNGIVLSEGAAVLLLCREDTAKERKFPIYARVLGFGSCFDPNKFYRYNLQGEGLKKAMGEALDSAGLLAQDIDCIFANANSTKDGDLMESKAIKEVFGEHAYKIPITAPKSALGEPLSAWGGLGVASSLLTLKEDVIPPILNYKEKDPDCDLNYVVEKPLKKKVSKVMINASDPNGFNTSLILGKYTD